MQERHRRSALEGVSFGWNGELILTLTNRLETTIEKQQKQQDELCNEPTIAEVSLFLPTKEEAEQRETASGQEERKTEVRRPTAK